MSRDRVQVRRSRGLDAGTTRTMLEQACLRADRPANGFSAALARPHQNATAAALALRGPHAE